MTVHATSDTEQHISLTRTTLVYTVASLQGSYGEAIPVSEVHELLLNSASRQHCEV